MHPLSEDPKRQMFVDPLRTSHIITNIGVDGNKVKARIESANTRAGRDFKGLVLQGSNVAFSMRGFSKVVEQNNDIMDVKGPLMIVCYDWVGFFLYSR